MKFTASLISAALLLSSAQAASTITIATVNNPDMITMQKLTPEFNKLYPDITVKWVVLGENSSPEDFRLP